jgi:hypothetical protein
MTAADVLERVEYIRGIAPAEGYRDYANAHRFEDALYTDVLRAIAEGADNPAELAAIALNTKAINFLRCCE